MKSSKHSSMQEIEIVMGNKSLICEAHIDFTYHPAQPATPPSYSSGGDPPEPESVEGRGGSRHERGDDRAALRPFVPGSPAGRSGDDRETRMSFTDQKRFIATEYDLVGSWGGYTDGRNFRCYLCGHRFSAGDGVRWVYAGGCSYEVNGTRRGVKNFMTCDACDGGDVVERWVEKNRAFSSFKREEGWALV